MPSRQGLGLIENGAVVDAVLEAGVAAAIFLFIFYVDCIKMESGRPELWRIA